ncbi:MAG TPA: DnaA/Hda family protein [Gemmatimonadaceae bacterium]|nr:DnaA/Hda family protein [Gemmatimonadaceae bacterium]
MSQPTRLRDINRADWPRIPANTVITPDLPSHFVTIEPDGTKQPVIRQHAPPAIPIRFQGADFESFICTTRAQRIALAAVRQWVADAAAHRGAMLALVGATGAGKSHLLYAATNALLALDEKVYARPWYTLANELRYGGVSPFTPTHVLEAAHVRRMLFEHRIVVIDEVRPTAGTAFDDTELAMFSCHAWDETAAVLITTNVNPLAEVMGAAAASRYEQIIVDGPDRRQR